MQSGNGHFYSVTRVSIFNIKGNIEINLHTEKCFFKPLRIQT